MRVFEK
jgi:hypothetical protein